MIPSFCYEKAFKVLMSITIIAVLGITGIAWAQILENSERSIENALELEKRYVPIYELMPQIYTNIEKLQGDVNNNHDNIIIICTTIGAPCK